VIFAIAWDGRHYYFSTPEESFKRGDVMFVKARALTRRTNVSLFAALVAFGLASQSIPLQAEPIKIVAIGASNTAGSAVGAGNAYPAVLERMLRAKGYDIRVENKGVLGDTSAGILSRIDSAITPGTKVVIFDAGGGNDKDTGAAAQTAGNKAAIEQRIRAHGATPIFAGVATLIGTQQTNPSAYIPGDKHYHVTAQSQARIAAILLPKVIAVIGKSK
jgi:acyl-CoA thioesterase-1